jgi:hypothetical protein
MRILSFTGSPYLYWVNFTEIATEKFCLAQKVQMSKFLPAGRQANAKGMPKRINVKTFLLQISQFELWISFELRALTFDII